MNKELRKKQREHFKELRNEYINTRENGKYVITHLDRSRIIGLIGLAFGIGMFVYTIISATGKWYEYGIYGFMIIFGILLYLFSTDYYKELLRKVDKDKLKKKKK